MPGWGEIWGDGWGGGGDTPVSAAAATGTRAILDQLTAVIVATGASLRPCGYRRPLELEPVGGSHRLFSIESTGGRIVRQLFGGGFAAVDRDVVVRVAYARLGGDAGGGDRFSVNRQAGEDATLIQDALLDSRNWNRDVTAIREIRMTGSGRDGDGPLTELWGSRFSVQVERPWPL